MDTRVANAGNRHVMDWAELGTTVASIRPRNTHDEYQISSCC